MAFYELKIFDLQILEMLWYFLVGHFGESFSLRKLQLLVVFIVFFFFYFTSNL